MVPMEQMQEPMALTRMDRETPTSVMEMEMATAMTSASVAVKLVIAELSVPTLRRWLRT